MIVKICTIDKGWLFISGKSVKTRVLTKEQYEFGIETCTPHHTHIDLETLYCADGQIFVHVINIDMGKQIVYTNLPVYLLNDEGKTIERI